MGTGSEVCVCVCEAGGIKWSRNERNQLFIHMLLYGLLFLAAAKEHYRDLLLFV